MSILEVVDSAQGEAEMELFSGVKVFSATKYRERSSLGDDITFWLRENPHVRVTEKVVTQSSDSEFHCLTITLFYREEAAGAQREKRRK